MRKVRDRLRFAYTTVVPFEGTSRFRISLKRLYSTVRAQYWVLLFTQFMELPCYPESASSSERFAFRTNRHLSASNFLNNCTSFSILYTVNCDFFFSAIWSNMQCQQFLEPVSHRSRPVLKYDASPSSTCDGRAFRLSLVAHLRLFFPDLSAVRIFVKTY